MSSVLDIKELFNELDAFRLPPVEKWHPAKSVDIGLRIDHRGKWFYQDSPIQRHRISKLFSTVLRLEGREYYLVTPPAKYRIQVEDAPFTAVELQVRGNGKDQELFFRTNMDEVVLADADHPIIVTVDPENQEPSPYVMVRDGLKAKIVRSVFYELANLLVADPEAGIRENRAGVYSAGQFFLFGEV